MANILTMLELEELSLVDNPANPLAMAPLYKRHTPEGEIMSEETKEKVELPEEVMAKLEEAERLITENESLRKALIDNGFVIKKSGVEKKAEEEFIEVDGEKINKADVPAPILKAMAKADEQNREIALEKRCEDILPNVKKDHAKVILAKFAEEEVDEELLEFFRAIDAIFADTMEEVGKKEAEADMTDPEEMMDALVKAYIKDNKLSNKDYAKAYAAVAKTDEGKSLISKTYKGDS